MDYVLVPHEVTQTTAFVWVGAFDGAPIDGALALTAGEQRISIAAWEAMRTKSGKTICHALVALGALTPARDYPLTLVSGDETLARGSVRTLPERLPNMGESSFSVMLGSCFCVDEDRGAKVGKAWQAVKDMDRPALKILCGDQVYLDAPWWRFSARTHAPQELRELFFETYRKTWTQAQDGVGFSRLLGAGATYFCSDDHEFWNNAPNGTVYVSDTWSEKGRSQWKDEAKALFNCLQSRRPVQSFEVGTVSFFIADTRIERSPERERFMLEADFERLVRWIQALEGPGMLVLGQPLFDTAADAISGRVFDWGLVDYAQYPRLVAAIAASRHSIVVLTGDVHYGRVAHCTLTSGVDVIEVISSPLTLVTGGRREWKPAPERFPSRASGVRQVAVKTSPFEMQDDHFLTLELSQKSQAVALEVRVWPVVQTHLHRSGQTVFRHMLY